MNNDFDLADFASYLEADLLDILAMNLVAKGWIDMSLDGTTFIHPETNTEHGILAASIMQSVTDYKQMLEACTEEDAE